jgi:hypothetical protein
MTGRKRKVSSGFFLVPSYGIPVKAFLFPKESGRMGGFVQPLTKKSLLLLP